MKITYRNSPLGYEIYADDPTEVIEASKQLNEHFATKITRTHSKNLPFSGQTSESNTVNVAPDDHPPTATHSHAVAAEWSRHIEANPAMTLWDQVQVLKESYRGLRMWNMDASDVAKMLAQHGVKIDDSKDKIEFIDPPPPPAPLPDSATYIPINMTAPVDIKSADSEQRSIPHHMRWLTVDEQVQHLDFNGLYHYRMAAISAALSGNLAAQLDSRHWTEALDQALQLRTNYDILRDRLNDLGHCYDTETGVWSIRPQPTSSQSEARMDDFVAALCDQQAIEDSRERQRLSEQVANLTEQLKHKQKWCNKCEARVKKLEAELQNYLATDAAAEEERRAFAAVVDELRVFAIANGWTGDDETMVEAYKKWVQGLLDQAKVIEMRDRKIAELHTNLAQLRDNLSVATTIMESKNDTIRAQREHIETLQRAKN